MDSRELHKPYYAKFWPILNRVNMYMELSIGQYFQVQDMLYGPVTTEEKAQKKNDMKTRSRLLMALPNEHLMTFNQYKDAKTLFAAIQTRFGGNEATKKTQKTLLKKMYENFSAPSTESLDSIFNRLQKIVSQLRNKPDLDTMSFDDLNNNFKIVEQEVKGTASSSSSSSSQNMAFVSSPSSTNEVNTLYGVSIANTQVSLFSTQVSTTSTQDLEQIHEDDIEEMDLKWQLALLSMRTRSPTSTQVSTASTQVSTANVSDDTVYVFLASQPNGSQLVYEDLEQIHEDDIEEMNLKWQLALLRMRTRRFFQKTDRKITINGSDTAGYDKSKVECFNCHKMGHFARECRGPRNQDSIIRNQDNSRKTVNVEETSSKAMVAIDGAGFEWSYIADDEVLTNRALMAFSDSEINNDKTYISYKDLEISMLKSELEKLKQEKESNQLKIENFDNASKSLDKLIGSQIPDKTRKEEFQQPEFEGYGPKPSKSVSEDTSNEVRESPDAPLVKELMSDDKL
ncbi:putative ribonuclease H-like domain-containing protein [Tanacetum coccineum]|uniref:Ribonuclease H-like domain-containing protein n=1 Tax=Tanacetum coccineum TaxID=301880 RepID=A0ABQ5GR45_9ASTR